MSHATDPSCPACAARQAMDACEEMSLDVVGGCPSKKSWIDLVLSDSDGEPVAGAKYQVEAADGSVHEGTLDGDGCATVRGIEPGTAVVRFPEYHAADFETELPPACRCAQTTWVEVELVDESGRPAAGAPYRVVLADGEVCEGTLDGNGKARVESGVSGPCRVSFPELERGACDLG
ncbi:MSCRAMM family protein [Paraliomyxa miuraensis]|uniref:MSCRAMM family protein n=1 Tax=Paraliomyxa miuraensis TaxID=376150 RepID=UPI0022591812|nr:carboxypeptidase-like regulatory domain-containing protein [Paraliomyxa miuraensis]MCX4247432.1 carboxypeptidase-like regulatory domain-containing protein [Paraliomyxa miuraensis]